MARCVWRINWLGDWVLPQRRHGWFKACAAVAGAGLLAGLAGWWGQKMSGSPGGLGVLLESCLSGDPGGSGAWGWGGLSEAGWMAAGAGALLRARWALVALWRPARVGAPNGLPASWWGWAAAPMAAIVMSNLGAMAWIFDRLRQEAARGGSAPSQALMGLIGLAGASLLMADLIMLMFALGVTAGGLGAALIAAMAGWEGAGGAEARAGLLSLAALMAAWARQGSVAAAWRGGKAALGSLRLKALGWAQAAGFAGVQPGASGLAGVKEKWGRALVERAAREGALSVAERESLESSLPRAKGGGDGARRL